MQSNTHYEAFLPRFLYHMDFFFQPVCEVNNHDYLQQLKEKSVRASWRALLFKERIKRRREKKVTALLDKDL